MSRGWCASPGPRQRRHRSGGAPVVAPARVRRHRAPSDGEDRWRPEARARAAPGAPVCSPRRGTYAHGRRRPMTASAARVGHRSPVAMHPYPMCAHRARQCTQINRRDQLSTSKICKWPGGVCNKRGWVVCGGVGVFFHSHVSVLASWRLFVMLCYVTVDQRRSPVECRPLSPSAVFEMTSHRTHQIFA